MYGAMTALKSRPLTQGKIAALAVKETLFISPGKAVLTSRYADAIPSRFTSSIAPSPSPI
jgi:hypothetical protein